MSTIAVAVALFNDKEGRYLITQRGKSSTYPDWWEFPGGKIEALETPEQALVREVYEELGVQVKETSYLGAWVHDYPERRVSLAVYQIIRYEGLVRICEQQQDLRWVTRHELQDYPLLAASRALINGLIVESID